MDSSYNDCDYFNLKYTSMSDELCEIANSLGEEYIVFGVFFLFILYAIYHKVRGDRRYKPDLSFNNRKVRLMRSSSTSQKLLIIVFFANLLFFVLFY